MTDDEGRKVLQVERLIELLKTLPPNCTVYCNRVGNLGICTHNGRYMGWIDFRIDGEVKLA